MKGGRLIGLALLIKRSGSELLMTQYFHLYPQVLVGGSEAAVEAGREAGLGGDVPPAPGGVHEVAGLKDGPRDLLLHVICAWRE